MAFDDPDSEWIIEDQHKDVRLRIPTAVLVVLLIAAVGFWGGAALQKHHGSTGAVAGSASARAAFANAASGRTGFGSQAAGGFSGTAGAATAAGAATTGLVTEVQGNTVYVTDDTGALVKVTVNASSSDPEDVERPRWRLADRRHRDRARSQGGGRNDHRNVDHRHRQGCPRGVSGSVPGGRRRDPRGRPQAARRPAADSSEAHPRQGSGRRQAHAPA